MMYFIKTLIVFKTLMLKNLSYPGKINFGCVLRKSWLSTGIHTIHLVFNCPEQLNSWHALLVSSSECNLQFQHSGAIQTDFDDDIYVDHNDDVDKGSDLEIFFAKNILFRKWSEMARKLVGSLFWHHEPSSGR